MPIYEYRCLKCGQRIEKLQKFADDPLTTCESCGGKLERVISPPAIQFKGTGWYVTDYARKGTPSDGSEAAKKESSAKGETQPGAAAGAAKPADSKSSDK